MDVPGRLICAWDYNREVMEKLESGEVEAERIVLK